MKYENLYQFLGNKLGQDAFDDGRTVSEIVTSNLRRYPVQHLEILLAELDDVLSDYPGEAALDDVLYSELGCYYYPPADGLTYRSWLEQLRSMIAAELAAKRP